MPAVRLPGACTAATRGRPRRPSRPGGGVGVTVVRLQPLLDEFAGLLVPGVVRGDVPVLEQSSGLEGDLQAHGAVPRGTFPVERRATRREHRDARVRELPLGVRQDVRGPRRGVVDVEELQDVPERLVALTLRERALGRPEERHQRRALAGRTSPGPRGSTAPVRSCVSWVATVYRRYVSGGRRGATAQESASRFRAASTPRPRIEAGVSTASVVISSANWMLRTGV